MDNRFENQAAIVTGGANGIGLCIVEKLIKENAKVAVLDIDEPALDKLSHTYKSKVMCIKADVSNKREVEESVKKVTADFKRIDLLFNNAGKISYAPFLELEEKDWDLLHRVNLKGMYLVGQMAARQMVQLGIKGRIVNTCSVTCETVNPTLAAYASTKGAIKQLTKVMALDLGEYGIRVNAVAPGPIETNMTALTRSMPDRVENFVNKLIIKRFGYPEDVANTALFLASDEAAYVSGTIYFVDGGWLTM